MRFANNARMLWEKSTDKDNPNWRKDRVLYCEYVAKHGMHLASALNQAEEALKEIRYKHSFHTGGCEGTVANAQCSCQLMVADQALAALHSPLPE
jgi:hypothetical protein